MVATNVLGFPLLTVILAIPTIGAVVCMLLEDERWIRVIANSTVVVDLILALVLLVKFELRPGGSTGWVFQFADKHSWVPSLGITYWLGVDGIAVFLVGLTTFVIAIAMAASNFMIVDRVKLFAVFVLFLETAILGVFMSVNLFLFFVFWEAMLIPAYFLLGMWGEDRRIYATTKFVVYTILGSFLMLVGIFYLWTARGTLDLPGPHGLLAHPISNGAQTWVFLAFFLAFAIKMPIWPFHTWAPTAYAESPAPVAIIIAGVLSKAGAFGLLRYCLPLFPHAASQFSSLISVLAIIGMLYAAGLALVQTDIKRIVAYSSISHMNLIALGIFALNATAFDGSILQMINHSVIITGLFLSVAYIAARTGTRQLSEMGGLGRYRPFLMWMFFVLVLGALDLPGLGSFSGEFLILAGVFRSNVWFSSVAAITVIFSAWYMIRFFQDTMNGTPSASIEPADIGDEEARTTVYQYPVRRRLLQGDLLPREAVLFVPLILLLIYVGVQPDPLTSRMNSTTYKVSTIVRPCLPLALSHSNQRSSCGP